MYMCLYNYILFTFFFFFPFFVELVNSACVTMLIAVMHSDYVTFSSGSSNCNDDFTVSGLNGPDVIL